MSPKGMGLIQFRENKTTIDDFRNRGYDKKKIYEQLEQNITISYVQFTRIWNKEYGETPQKNATERRPVTKHLVAKKTTPSTPPQSGDIFRNKPKVIHNPSMTEERKKELF